MTSDETINPDEIVVQFGRAAHLVDITPQLAQQMLDTMPGRPPADEGKVKAYVAAMRDGTWRLMPHPIVYRRGRLLSSRHRLTAIIEYGHPVPMYVSDDTCPA